LDATDSEVELSNELRQSHNIIDIIKIMIALIPSIIVITLYIIAMFIDISMVYQVSSTMNNVFIYSFYSILILLIIFEIIPRHYGLRTYLFILILFLTSLYMIFGALREIQHLKSGYFFIIPPSLIFISCSIPQNCSEFYTISFSIPLLLSFILLIYGIYTLLIYVRRTVFT